MIHMSRIEDQRIVWQAANDFVRTLDDLLGRRVPSQTRRSPYAFRRGISSLERTWKRMGHLGPLAIVTVRTAEPMPQDPPLYGFPAVELAVGRPVQQPTVNFGSVTGGLEHRIALQDAYVVMFTPESRESSCRISVADEHLAKAARALEMCGLGCAFAIPTNYGIGNYEAVTGPDVQFEFMKFKLPNSAVNPGNVFRRVESPVAGVQKEVAVYGLSHHAFGKLQRGLEKVGLRW